MQLNNQRFIDLFAGIGGFHTALASFGAKCVFACEWDMHASKTYHANYGILPFGDITKIDEAAIPAHHILCAGFPCQAFSISGKQQGFDDVRGTLFFEIARIVKHHQPKLILLENVKNFIKHNNQNTLKTVLKILDELNYQVFYQVLNASDFGLPQNRERVYFVCFRKDIFNGKFSFPQKISQSVALQDFLQPNPSDAKIVMRDDMIFNKDFKPNRDMFGNVILPNRPIQIGIVNKGGQGERIYHTLGHAITLSAYGGGVGSKTGLYKVGDTVRKLSPRECARIQGFDDNFKIISSSAQAYQQFGNSVAVNVLKAILAQIEKTSVLAYFRDDLAAKQSMLSSLSGLSKLA
ncbi:DNA-cytosine methyltransferase [Moraxella macacae 0408225]|uniref:DNA (cytosine-5-)-methyltransferase n=1 Tax=Moraxella macacae 0408225 TaxID=1230338 RepID=L2F8R3_9GAMM|nr:DNA cytosine methyltransferase [Moraxella macacae]ELA09136.1 DNA-cytosine methyltransferase [Moraxella macacae 0408225]